MVSEWRVVEASTTGTIDAYLVEDFITIENLNGNKEKVFISELNQINKRIVGVVSLDNGCWFINIIDKLEQKALNCLDIEVTCLGTNNKMLGNYVWGECLLEGFKFIDLLYSALNNKAKGCTGLQKIDELTYSIDSRYNGIVYRSIYVIQDLSKFELYYTKYHLLRN